MAPLMSSHRKKDRTACVDAEAVKTTGLTLRLLQPLTDTATLSYGALTNAVNLNPHTFNTGEDKLFYNKMNLSDERESLEQTLRAHLS